MVIAVTSTATVVKARAIELLVTVLSASGVTTASRRFVLLVAIVYTNVVSSAYKLITDVYDTIIVPTKKTMLKLSGVFTSILVRPSKTNVVASKQDDLDG
jgi:hypothetical protein